MKHGFVVLMMLLGLVGGAWGQLRDAVSISSPQGPRGYSVMDVGIGSENYAPAAGMHQGSFLYSSVVYRPVDFVRLSLKVSTMLMPVFWDSKLYGAGAGVNLFHISGSVNVSLDALVLFDGANFASPWWGGCITILDSGTSIPGFRASVLPVSVWWNPGTGGVSWSYEFVKVVAHL